MNNSNSQNFYQGSPQTSSTQGMYAPVNTDGNLQQLANKQTSLVSGFVNDTPIPNQSPSQVPPVQTQSTQLNGQQPNTPMYNPNVYHRNQYPSGTPVQGQSALGTSNTTVNSGDYRQSQTPPTINFSNSPTPSPTVNQVSNQSMQTVPSPAQINSINVQNQYLGNTNHLNMVNPNTGYPQGASQTTNMQSQNQNIPTNGLPPLPDNFTQNQTQQVIPGYTPSNTEQIAINEDYADNFNPNLQLTLGSRASLGIQPNQQGVRLNQANTIASVNQKFADSSQVSDDNFTSTGFLPLDDDGGADDVDMVNDDLVPMPYGFSDFDPNEQGQTRSDVGDFDSEGLEEVAEDIYADFSEHFVPSNTQSVGVLTQDPLQQGVLQNNLTNNNLQASQYTHFTQNYVQPQVQGYGTTVPLQYAPIEPQREPVPASQIVTRETKAELSPAAKLNQLLEAEEAAEKVIIQKQNQVLKRSAKPKTIQVNKNSIFQQLDPDGSLQGDMKNSMSRGKPTSRYFLIISLVIIISVVGFLLVLLGLSLL